MYAFAPVAFLTLTLVLPISLKLLHGIESVGYIAVIALLSVALVTAGNASLRIINYSSAAQAYSCIHAGIAFTLIRQLFNSSVSARILIVVSVVSIVVYFTSILYALFVVGDKTNVQHTHWHKHEYEQMTLPLSLIIRASRTGRFVTANGFLILIITIMLYAGHRSATALPFDAAVVLGLLLTGTIAMESRSLSNKTYPTEHVMYGLIKEWLAGTWVIAYGIMIFVVGAFLILSATVFSGQLSTTGAYVGAFGLSLTAVGIIAGVLVAPQHDDIVSQLGATILYGIFAWIISKILAHIAPTSYAVLATATIGIVGLSLVMSYAYEKQRWLKTIKGSTDGRIF
jgi:hypothetical protein